MIYFTLKKPNYTNNFFAHNSEFKSWLLYLLQNVYRMVVCNFYFLYLIK